MRPAGRRGRVTTRSGGPSWGVRAGQAGCRAVIRGGGVSPQARRMTCWAVVGSVVWVTVPVGPVRVTACSRPSSRARGGQVWRGREAAVDHGDHPASPPGRQVVLDLRQSLIAGVPRPAPDPHRNALPGYGQADDDLRQVGSGVLGVSVPAQPPPVLGVVVFTIAFEVGAGG